MKSYWQDIAPAMAADLQKSDSARRSLSAHHARALARDMAAGRWKPSPQGIILDHLGRLMDGWHRMRAVVLSGVTVRMYVTETESEAETKEIEMILDLGRARTFSDRLQFEGRVNTRTLAAMIRHIHHWREGDIWAHRTAATSEELDQVAREEPDLDEAARYGKTWKEHGDLLSGSIVGFCWWVLHQVDAEDAETFLYALKSGAGLNEGSPVLALRERLRGDSVASTSRRRLTPMLRVWLVFTTWNHFRAGRSVKLIKTPVNPITNENFPRPV